jgi:hypothetical protein
MRRSGTVSEISQRGEGDEADRWGPHGSDVREKASLSECVKSKEIHLSANTPRLLGPNGLSGDSAACGAKRASVGRDGPKSEEDSFSNKNWIFEYTKALEICTRRFRRNFDMRVFIKSSRLSKYFGKMKYAMPWYATLGKIN